MVVRVHLDDFSELSGCNVGRVLDRLKVDRRARAVALELDNHEPTSTWLGPHDAQDVEAFGRPVKAIELGCHDREVAAGQVRG